MAWARQKLSRDIEKHVIEAKKEFMKDTGLQTIPDTDLFYAVARPGKGDYVRLDVSYNFEDEILRKNKPYNARKYSMSPDDMDEAVSEILNSKKLTKTDY